MGVAGGENAHMMAFLFVVDVTVRAGVLTERTSIMIKEDHAHAVAALFFTTHFPAFYKG